MLKQVFRLTLTACFGLFLFTACDQEEFSTSSETENFVFNTIEDMETRAACGRLGCYEFVFPVSVDFPDNTTQEVESYEELRESVRAWYEANGRDTLARPTLSYPIEVVSEEGEFISVDNAQDLFQLRRDCRRQNRPHRPRVHKPCFTLVYPLSIEFPDGTSTEVENRRQAQLTVRAWKAANRDSEERPTLAYPLSVEFTDGTVLEVASAEALKELKETCNDDANDE